MRHGISKRLALSLWTLGCAAGCELEAKPTDWIDMPATPHDGVVLGSTKPCSDDAPACGGDHAPYRTAISAFQIQKTEVTRLQYQIWYDKRKQAGAEPTPPFNAAQQDYPVRIGNPMFAELYCNEIDARLPTEAEFEYASRFRGEDQPLADYPWGDDKPDCAHADHHGCPGGPSAVGTHALDRNERGVLDLAGSVPEWTADFYAPNFQCQDRVRFTDLCTAMGQSCADAYCEANPSCFKGCLPGAASNEYTKDGADLPDTPVCVASVDGLRLRVNPRNTASSESIVVRGGAPEERACLLAGYTRRHASPGKGAPFYAGFRCVKGAIPETPGAFRFVLEGCPAPDRPVRIEVTANGVPVVYELGIWPATPGPFTVRPADEQGVVAGLRCADHFVVRPRTPGPLHVRVADSADEDKVCAAWTAEASTSAGDEPASGFRSIPLAGRTCMLETASGDCTGKSCQLVCKSGRADCDTEFQNGCEIDIANDVQHCGGCKTPCPALAHASTACTGGTCGLQKCDAQFDSCDSDPKNGCETRIATDPKNCGACGRLCSANHVASLLCTDGRCSGPCEVNYGDCNHDEQLDGCETNTQDSADHCGACDTPCPKGQRCLKGNCTP